MRNGFTLIELSIVLVIIGLIVGGILVGQELVKAAQIRTVISEAGSYQSAYDTFLGKYGCVPGDCSQSSVTSFGLAGLGSKNPATLSDCNNAGNNDGLITSYFGVATNDCGSDSGYEGYDFWGMLQAAGLAKFYLIKGNTPASQLTTKLGRGQWIVTSFQPYYSTRGGNYLVLSTAPFNNQNLWGEPVLTPEEAFAIDSKIDDGYPMSGAVRASYSYYRCGDNTPLNQGSCFNLPLAVSTIGTTYPGYGANETCVDDTAAPTKYKFNRVNSKILFSCEISIRIQ